MAAPPGGRRVADALLLARERSTWIHGQYAGAPSSSTHRPHAILDPRDLAWPQASSASLILPIPGSPARSARPPRPGAQELE